MRLADYLKEDYVLGELNARSKDDAIDELAGAVCSRVDGIDCARLREALEERERLGTTGIGHGVAIPHGKMKDLSEIRVFFARSRKGVEYNSMDRLPVHLFFLIVAPVNSAASHLKILAAISHLLKNQDFRSRLMTAATGSEVFRIIAEADRRNVTL